MMIHRPILILTACLLLASLCSSGCSSKPADPVIDQHTPITGREGTSQYAGSPQKAAPPVDPRVKKLEEIYRLRTDQSAFPDALRAIHNELPELVVTAGDQPLQWNSLKIAELSPTFSTGNKLFDAFRFRSPLNQPADLHWIFGVPQQVGSWNILPLKGAMRSFESYQIDWNLDIPGVPLPPGNAFVFQELLGGRILPGEEYIIWYKPSAGSPNAFHAALRLTPAGTHTSASTAEDIARILGVPFKVHEFPQTPAGLQAAFDTAGRMAARNTLTSEALRRVLGSVWPLLPEIRVKAEAGKPVWNHLTPDISFQFHAVRCRSSLKQPADMHSCHVVEHDALTSGIVTAQGELRGSHHYAVQVNCPLSGSAFPTENLTRFESLTEGPIDPDTEYVLWFAPKRGAMPDFDLTLQFSPAGSLPTQQDDGRSIAAVLGFDLPETPSPERVAATLRRCQLMAQDDDMNSWEFHRMIQFAAPGLPVLEAPKGDAHWSPVTLDPNGKALVAYQLVPEDTTKGHVMLAVAKPSEPKMYWGFALLQHSGIWPGNRRQEENVSLADSSLPSTDLLAVDLYYDWDLERDGPLVVVFSPIGPAPLTFHVAAKVDLNKPAAQLSSVDSRMDAMGLRLKRDADSGGQLGSHDGTVYTMQFIDDAILATSSEDGTIRLWNTSQREAPPLQSIPASYVTALATSHDRSRLACAIASYSQITIRDAKTLAEQTVLRMPREQLSQHVSFSPDGRSLLASDSGSLNGRKSVLCVWDLEQGGPPKMLDFENRTIIGTAHWLPDGKTIVAAGRRTTGEAANATARFFGELRFIDSETLKVTEMLTENGDSWQDMAVSADGRRIVAFAASGLIRVWDAHTREPVASLVQECIGRLMSLSADGTRVATLADSGAIRVWDIDEHKIIRRWAARKPEPSAIALSPDGKVVAFSGSDGHVRLFMVDDPGSDDDTRSHPRRQTNSLNMELALVPTGKFEMGIPVVSGIKRGTGPQPHEQPVHGVEITRPYYMGVHEVTVAQFRAFVEATGYRTTAEAPGQGGSHIFTSKVGFETKPDLNWKSPGFKQEDNHPVVQVSWHDAVAFCEWLSKTEGKRYRLPTEAEWEYACRAGSSTLWCFGNSAFYLWRAANTADHEIAKVYGNYGAAMSESDGYAFTAPVDGFISNEFGLYNMHGNVWEWCHDWYDAVYYSYSPPENPTGAKQGKARVQRGGGFMHNWNASGSGRRDSGPPEQAMSCLGFRVVQEVP